jgi:di/tricarboxylate transporter
MPMAFAAVLGGNLTVIGNTPNLLVNGYLDSRTGTPFGMFEFFPIGLAITVAGIAFTVMAAGRLLPRRSHEERMREAMLPEELAQSYGLAKNLCRMRVLPKSEIAGKTIAEAGIRSHYGLSIVMVVRPPGGLGAALGSALGSTIGADVGSNIGTTIGSALDSTLASTLGEKISSKLAPGIGPRYLDPKRDLVLEPGDQLYIEGNDERAWQLAEEKTLQFALAGPQAIERILGRGQTLAEVTLSPRSGSFGKTLRDLGFGSRYEVNALSLWRRGAPISGAADTPLELGDAFLVSGPAARLRDLSRDPDYIVLGDLSAAVDMRRAPLAMLLLLVAVVPPIIGLAPIALSAMTAALLMVVTGCVTPDDARRALDWKAIFLIAGTMPLAIALERTGVAARIAGGILDAVTSVHGGAETIGGGAGAGAAIGALGGEAGVGAGAGAAAAGFPFLAHAAVVATLFLLAALVSIASSNSAAALIIAPIAGQAAATGAIDLRTGLLAVAFGCSCSFILPIAQWNIMVMAPGGYRPRDFLRYGGAMTVVVALVAIGLLSIR